MPGQLFGYAICIFCVASVGCAQTTVQPPKPGVVGSSAEPPPISTAREHWVLSLQETFSPLSLAGTIFGAGFSQVTNSDPRYGTNGTALGQRFGASASDIASQNFFGDFLIGSALNEDPRYFRMGEGHRFWRRVGYAVSRSIVTRTGTGGSSVNWANLGGSAMSAGFSNLYYPDQSRNLETTMVHFITSAADTGFVKLAPEFWPDFRRKVFGRHHQRP